MDEYKSRLSDYLSDMVREELEKYDGGFTDEWNDQRKKNAEVLGYELEGTSDINEELQNSQGEQTDFKKGDLVKDINPDCPHHGSEGKVTKVGKGTITFDVTNNGRTYKEGDELEKTVDQMVKLKESVNESDLGLTYKKGKTIKVTHKKSGKELVIIDKPNVRREYQKIGYFAEGTVNEAVDFRPTMKKLAKSLGIKSVSQYLAGKGSLSYFLDDEREAKKLEKFLGRTFRRVRLIRLDKSKGDTANFVVAADVKGIVESVNEGKWSKIMRSVRKGSKSGPWSIVVYDKRERKVKHQRLVKILQQIPAHYEDVKKKYPRDKIGIEDKHGERVYTESINERRGISISEKGMVFFLDQLVNSMEHYDEREFVRGLGKKLGIDSKVMKRIWKNYDKVHASFRDKWTDRHWERWLNKQGITEDTKRDYKAEYKKFQSSTKAKKYRAELNKYNRQKGTYGNGDGKDASHKGGKIAGFEKESTNRGRREKSRLKKESIITEAKYKETYKSITARDKDYKRIWPIGGHPRVKIISWSETEATGRMKTAYIQIEGDKKWVDAYKKIAFNGRGSSSDVVKFVREKTGDSNARTGNELKEFSGDQGIHVYLGGIVNSLRKAGIKAKTAEVMKHGFSKSRDKIGFFVEVLDRKREKYTLQLEIDRDGYLWYLSAPKDMKLGKWADTSKVVRSLKAISKLPDFGQSSLKRR